MRKLLLGSVVYFIMIPIIYGKFVSFFDWLFTDPQNVINTLRNPNSVLAEIHIIVGLKIFWWIWTICFIAALFFVGKS